MARDRIEKLAIADLEKVLLKSKYVIPQISENDKTPSFDGELLVYSTEDHTKDRMEGRIPVQVKGVTVEAFTGKCTYSFAWADLENYYKDKGCLFFVVQLLGSDDEQYRVYYKEWPLLELQKILQKYPAPREHETISLPLIEFPTQKDAIDSLLFNFCNDMRKQLVVNGWTQLPSLEEFDGGKFEIQLTAFGADKLQPLQVLTKEARYLYKRTAQGLFPVSEGKVKISVNTEQDMPVSVNGVRYYDICTGTHKEGKVIYHIGDSFEFEFLEKNARYSVNLSNSLRKREYDLRFLLAAIEHGSFEIAEHIHLGMGELAADEETVKQWKGYYGDVEFFVRFLDRIGVKDDLQLNQLKNGEDVRLNKLANGVLSGEVYECKKPESIFCVTPIGNLQILLVYEEIGHSDEGYQYKLHSLKEIKLEIPSVVEGEEGREVPVISYVRHEKPEMLGTISNLDWERLVNEYERLVDKDREFYAELATEDMLAMIDQYHKTKKGYLLENAMRVQEWLAKQYRGKEGKQIMALNRLQIVRRMRELTENERGELAAIAAKAKNAKIRYGAHVLLGEKANAKYWYGQLSDEEREEVDGQPIARFREF